MTRGVLAKPRILYVGYFDIASLMERSRRGDAPSNHVHALPDLERHGFEVVGFDMGGPENARGWAAQRRVLAQSRGCQLILAHAHYDVRWLAVLRRAGALKVPLAAFVHTHNVKPWHRLHLPGFDLLLPVGATGARRLLDNGAEPARVTQFPYGADLRYYAAPLPWPDAEPIVLSVGVSGRDFGTLVDAAAAVNAAVHVVGRVSKEDVARAPPNMTFHSHGNYDLSFEQLLALYARARCVAVVHHGTDHPFGITAIVEALALGRPVVATRSAGYDIDVDALGAGRGVPAHDAALLAQAINGVMARPAEARAMGLCGRRAIESQFNGERGAAVLAASFSALLERPH